MESSLAGRWNRRRTKTSRSGICLNYVAAEGDTHPDHDTIAAFRKRHSAALAGLFVQVLLLYKEAGLVKLGHVAIDGAKIKANASKHKAMSYERMEEAERRLRQEVQELPRRAATAEEAEDAQFGKGKSGDELPAEVARRESRLEKIREAKAELEKEAKEKEERQRVEAEAKIAERREQEAQTGQKAGGHDRKVLDPEQAKPDANAQRVAADLSGGESVEAIPLGEVSANGLKPRKADFSLVCGFSPPFLTEQRPFARNGYELFMIFGYR